LHQKNTARSLFYVARDVLFAVTLYKLGWLIDPFAHLLVNDFGVSSAIGSTVKWLLWAFYWYWQGLVLTGWWCLSHEAGHGTLSPYNWVNHLIGFSMHTVVFSLYLAAILLM
jgi:omega-6 fatty acid desaturase (delta-12 desaturase)